MTPAGRRALRHLIGAGVAAAALYASTASLNWTTVIDAFRGASTLWVAVAVVSVLLTLVLVTARWSVLAGNQAVIGRWRVLWNAVVLGQAVNIVAPLRFGEGARLALTCRGLGLPAGRVMVGLAVERALDMAAFASGVLLLLVAGLMPNAFAGIGPAAATLSIGTIAAVVVFVRWLPDGLTWLRRRVGLPVAVARWLELQEGAVRDGWTDLRRGGRLATTALMTALILVGAASTNLLVIAAFHLDVPVVAALVLLLVLQAGTAVVSVPGNIGVFHYLTVATLAAWQVPRPTALALAIVLHIVSLGPKVLLGGIVLATAKVPAKILLSDANAS